MEIGLESAWNPEYVLASPPKCNLEITLSSPREVSSFDEVSQLCLRMRAGGRVIEMLRRNDLRWFEDVVIVQDGFEGLTLN